MCKLIIIAAFLAYIFAVQYAVVNTWTHFRNGDHVFRAMDILRPEVYTPAGNRLRRAALAIMVIGAAAFVAVSLGCTLL